MKYWFSAIDGIQSMTGMDGKISIPTITKNFSIYRLASRSLVLLTLFMSCTRSQNAQGHSPRLVGGQCEGCEAVLEYGDEMLSPVDTLPGFLSATQKLMVDGTIYQADGVTPAEGVILYVYHTDENGIYAPQQGAKGWARRHGYRRGWMRTGSDGRYTFHTGMPGRYPNGSEPAHIHATILEPGGRYYWVGSYFFAGDRLLGSDEISPKNPRGNSPGVLHLSQHGDLLVGHRNFVLGRNIPGYH